LRFKNVDKQVVLRLILPGSIGAFLGACFLGSIPGNLIKPYISFFLLLLGFYVIYRFLIFKQTAATQKNISAKQLLPLGFIAGFMDSTGGGGWGPIATPVLLTSNSMEPRKVIGSVDTSEFAVAVSSTLGFLITLGWSEINIQWVLALMIGGIIAAPIAAWLVRIIPTKLLGVLVGGIIIITNLRTLLGTMNISHTASIYTYLFLSVLWVTAIVNVVIKLRKGNMKSISLGE
jgi:uncharacterized membrane protein YfcA